MSSSKSTTAYQDPADSPWAQELVSYLNELDKRLGIPVAIESPYELTPSLLLAILESITRQRLPIPQAIRRARDRQSKVQTMKIFLGVLESDVLREDVGLSEVDPRRLAAGEYDEVLFVGEVLCWLGKAYGFVPEANIAHPRTRGNVYEDSAETSWHESSHVQGRPRPPSPSTPSSATTRDTANSYLSMMPSGPAATTDTTILSVELESGGQAPSLSDLDLFDAPSRIGRYSTSTPPPPSLRTPRHVHEADDPSFLPHDASATHTESEFYDKTRSENCGAEVSEDASTYCECPSDPESPLARYASRTPVRRSGWIEEVDLGDELRTFKGAMAGFTPAGAPENVLSRIQNYSGPSVALKTPTAVRPPGRVVTRHTSPTQYTLALLNERAKLMEELASLKAMKQADSASRIRRS